MSRIVPSEQEYLGDLNHAQGLGVRPRGIRVVVPDLVTNPPMAG